jgi:hypothetical protein
MAISISEKGKHIVQMIKTGWAAGVLVPRDKVLTPDERPVTYIGPVMGVDIQMHEFHLFDGTEVILEAPALNQKPGQVALLVTCEATEPVSC